MLQFSAVTLLVNCMRITSYCIKSLSGLTFTIFFFFLKLSIICMNMNLHAVRETGRVSTGEDEAEVVAD